MNRTAQFRNYYNEELLPVLKKLDNKRSGIIIQIVLVLTAGIVLIPLAAYTIISVIEQAWILMLFIPIFALLAFLFYIIYDSMYKNTSFYKDYKRNVIKRVISFVDPSLHYDNRLYININDFFRSNFYSKVKVKYDGDDHVSGKIDNVEVEFSELEVEYKNSADNPNNNPFMFKGIFFVAKAPTPFPADLVIETRKPGMVRAGELDTKDPAFNDLFIAWAPNDNEREAAMELLTDDLINTINGFHAVIPNPLKISFGYDKLFVAVEHGKSLFEPELWQTCQNFDDVLMHYQHLYYPMSVISHLAAHHELHFEAPNGK